MKIGDLVRAKIIPGHPMGVIMYMRRSIRWGEIYHVDCGSWQGFLIIKQMELVCEG